MSPAISTRERPRLTAAVAQMTTALQALRDAHTEAIDTSYVVASALEALIAPAADLDRRLRRLDEDIYQDEERTRQPEEETR